MADAGMVDRLEAVYGVGSELRGASMLRGTHIVADVAVGEKTFAQSGEGVFLATFIVSPHKLLLSTEDHYVVFVLPLNELLVLVERASRPLFSTFTVIELSRWCFLATAVYKDLMLPITQRKSFTPTSRGQRL